MSVRSILLALLSLIALTVGALWLARTPSTAREVLVEPRPAPSAPEAGAPVHLAVPQVQDRVQAQVAHAAAVWTPTAEDLAGASWVEGRIVVPEGLPAGESIRLEARGRAFRSGGRHSILLGADGAFRLAFSKESKTGTLVLSSRFLYLDEPKLSLPYMDGPLTLAAELRGALEGKITLSAIAEPRRDKLAGTRVRLRSKSWSDSPQRNGRPPDIKLAEDAGVQFDALPPATDWELSLPGGEFTEVQQAGIKVEAGKLTEVELAPRLCARLRGKVVDAAGAPLSSAVFEHALRGTDSPKPTRIQTSSGK